MAWIKKAVDELEFGERLFIEANNRKDQKHKLNSLQSALELMAQSAPTAAATLVIFEDLRDSKLWVIIKRIRSDPTIAYVKDNQGKVRRVRSTHDPTKMRRLRLMVLDGLTFEDIVTASDGLSDTEMEYVQSLLARERRI